MTPTLQQAHISDHDSNEEEEDVESLERALADVELLQAAYPDEISLHATNRLPLRCQLHLSLLSMDGSNSDAYIELEFPPGYPTSSSIQVSAYRSKPHDKARMDAAVIAVRQAAAESFQEHMESGLACCAAAWEAWNHPPTTEHVDTIPATKNSPVPLLGPVYSWRTGEPLMDRKSVFQAHICRVTSELQVQEALGQLLDGNSKLQRATHNMYAYRLTEVLPNGTSVCKHDNDDDGEDGAGSRLAQLLEMRKEDGVLLVVSRWFGGIQLGPKRFAHISNVARELLVSCHGDHWIETVSS